MVVGKEWVQPGTTVNTDYWASSLELHEEGFSHVTVNQSIAFVFERTGAHMNTIEGT
jgi:hypothetical protein